MGRPAREEEGSPSSSRAGAWRRGLGWCPLSPEEAPASGHPTRGLQPAQRAFLGRVPRKLRRLALLKKQLRLLLGRGRAELMDPP